MLVRTLLGLEPVGNRLLVDPQLPGRFGWLEVIGIPGAWGRADAYGRGSFDIDLERLETTLLGTSVPASRPRSPEPASSATP
jgi:hypothetical protein